MIEANTVFIIIGSLVTILGIIALFVPKLTRIINAPGGPRLKAIIAIITGIIIMLIGIFVEIPTG
jgi:hypothetical protein